jgi:uncharacterized membrane protein
MLPNTRTGKQKLNFLKLRKASHISGGFFTDMRILLLFFTPFILLSCNQSGNPIQVKSPAPVLVEDTLKIIKKFNGIYKNNGTGRFIDCEHPEMTYLLENPKLDSALRKILPNAYPGEGIFVNMMAEINASSDKNYAGTLELKELLKTELKDYTNTCIPYDFWCMGTEPFWHLQISEKENLIDLYDPMEQKTIHADYVKPEVTENSITYTTLNNIKKINFRIVILKEKCSDGMSEREFNYKATVLLNGVTEYNGCAVKYGEKLTSGN